VAESLAVLYLDHLKNMLVLVQLFGRVLFRECDNAFANCEKIYENKALINRYEILELEDFIEKN
jgi:calcineurin-like phosphoesterase